MDIRIGLLIPIGIVITGYISKVVQQSMLQGKGYIYRPEKMPMDVKVVGAILRIAGIVCVAVGVILLYDVIQRWD